jgi:hypothetical protein
MSKQTTSAQLGGPSDVARRGDDHDETDWRHQTLQRMRELIHAADRDIIEETKWVKPSNPDGVPTWTRDGIVCTGEVYKGKVKLTFARGASIPDPDGIFNASLDAGTRRAIDLYEGDDVDAEAFKSLIQRAVALNATRKK